MPHMLMSEAVQAVFEPFSPALALYAICIILPPPHNRTVVQHQQRKVALQEFRFMWWEEPYLPDIAANLAALDLEHKRNWVEEHPGEDPSKVPSSGSAPCLHLIMWCSVKGLHLT